MLNKYKKTGVAEIGTDKAKIDSPEFRIVQVIFDRESQEVRAVVKHWAKQGTIEQQHERTETMLLTDLPEENVNNGTLFLDAVQSKILELPQYLGAEIVPE